MPTSNITWTNNSLTSNPAADDTLLERTEQIAFTHMNAMPTSVDSWQGSADPGLDPSIANGSYADTTVNTDTHVSYRVKTARAPGGVGDEVTSIPSGFDYIYDSASELGYPNGYPAVAPNYQCSIEPEYHFDSGRTYGYDHGSPEEMFTLPGLKRHDQSGNWVTPFASATSTPGSDQVLNNTTFNYRRTFSGYGGYTSVYRKLQLGSPQIAFQDGVTIFRAVYSLTAAHDNATYSAGQITTVGGIDYTRGDMKCIPTAVGCVYHWAATSGAQARAAPFWAIHAYRLNNTALQHATGTIKGQSFVNGGATIVNSANVVGDSCHDAGGNKGAYGITVNLAAPLIAPGYSMPGLHFGEELLFGEALGVGDMNAVFGYLCGKFGETFTPLSSGDLVG